MVHVFAAAYGEFEFHYDIYSEPKQMLPSLSFPYITHYSRPNGIK